MDVVIIIRSYVAHSLMFVAWEMKEQSVPATHWHSVNVAYFNPKWLLVFWNGQMFCSKNERISIWWLKWTLYFSVYPAKKSYTVSETTSFLHFLLDVFTLVALTLNIAPGQGYWGLGKIMSSGAHLWRCDLPMSCDRLALQRTLILLHEKVSFAFSHCKGQSINQFIGCPGRLPQLFANPSV